MIGLKFSIDAALARKKLDRVVTDVIPYAKTTAKELAWWACEEIKKRTPETAPGRTNIKNWWSFNTTRKGSMVSYVIRNMYKNQDVILYFEEGTKPHVIEPVEKQALRWIDGGEERFAKSVAHPGTMGHFMVELTRRDLEYKTNLYIQNTFRYLDTRMK